MRRNLVIVGIVFVTAACGGGKKAAPVAVATDAAADAAPADAAGAAVKRIDAAAALAGLATRGPACLVVRAPDGAEYVSDATVCAERLRPMSTFKVPNAVIGADVGLLDGPDAMMEYDAKKYPLQRGSNPEWGKDQTLQKALEISAVPLFRLLATRIGAQRMQEHLDAFEYGNRSIAGGIDSFWLNGGLAISAAEQVAFVSKLVAGKLPAGERAQETVRAALPTETRGGATLHHKTGTGYLDGGPTGGPKGNAIGWLVGWVERAEGPYVFACWIKQEAADVDVVKEYRMHVCKGALERADLY